MRSGPIARVRNLPDLGHAALYLPYRSTAPPHSHRASVTSRRSLSRSNSRVRNNCGFSLNSKLDGEPSIEELAPEPEWERRWAWSATHDCANITVSWNLRARQPGCATKPLRVRLPAALCSYALSTNPLTKFSTMESTKPGNRPISTWGHLVLPTSLGAKRFCVQSLVAGRLLGCHPERFHGPHHASIVSNGVLTRLTWWHRPQQMMAVGSCALYQYLPPDLHVGHPRDGFPQSALLVQSRITRLSDQVLASNWYAQNLNAIWAPHLRPRPACLVESPLLGSKFWFFFLREKE